MSAGSAAIEAGLDELPRLSLESRCSLLRALIDHCWGPIHPEHGLPGAQLEDGLPAALRTLYGYVGRRLEIVRAQNRLALPGTRGPVLVENQGCFRVDLASWSEPDPLVLWSYDARAERADIGLRLSELLLQVVISEWVFRSPCLASHELVTGPALSELRGALRVMPAAAWPWPVRTPFVYGHGILGFVHEAEGRQWVYLGARSLAAFEPLRHLMDARWEDNPFHRR